MTIINRSRSVSYSCEQMYNLVNAVEDYAQFLPYCTGVNVHHRDENEVQATMIIGASGVNKSFTTRNLLQTNKMIEIRLIDGPFSHLEGFWRFDENSDNGCIIAFDLEFEFAGKLISMFLGPIFDKITDQMVDAFCDRAEIVYGKN